MDTGFLLKVLAELVPGLPVTFALAASALLAGAILAAGLTAMSLSGRRWLMLGAWTYIQLMRSIPMLALLFILYYGLGQFVWFRQSALWVAFKEPMFCAFFALALKSAAYASEVFRGGLLAVPPGDIVAARSVGMSGVLLYRRLILPVAVRLALPAYGNELIVIVKATSLASLVTVMDVTGIANALASESFRPLEVMAMAALLYLCINAAIARIVFEIEKRLLRYLQPARLQAAASAGRIAANV